MNFPRRNSHTQGGYLKKRPKFHEENSNFTNRFINYGYKSNIVIDFTSLPGGTYVIFTGFEIAVILRDSTAISCNKLVSDERNRPISCIVNGLLLTITATASVKIAMLKI